MYTFTTSLLLLLSLLSIVIGAPANTTISSADMALAQIRICETTAGSPYLTDILGAAEAVAKRTFCCQDNSAGSWCTQLSDYGSAAIGICGGPYCIYCDKVRDAALEIGSNCHWKDPEVDKYRAGGQIRGLDHNLRVIVYHT